MTNDYDQNAPIEAPSDGLPRALVTGAGGLIGSTLVEYLRKRGTDVTAVDRAVGDDTSDTVVADVSAPHALDDYLDEDTTVFHLAASADVAGSVADPRSDLRHTFNALFEVLESARRVGCRVIFPSTASVCGEPDTLPLSERALPRPASPYAAGKIAGEAYCMAYHRAYELDVRVVRFFNVYGPRMRRFAIHDIVRKIENDTRQIAILGDGNQIRDYLHVDDAARGLHLVATRGSPGEIYNVASGLPVRLLDLARLIATLMGYPDIELVPTGRSFPGDTPRWFADISKIRALGFEPRIGLEKGLAETIRSLAKQVEAP